MGKCGRNGKLDRNWWQTLRGGVALLVNMRYRTFVDKKEADRRATICVSCPNNMVPDGHRHIKQQFIKWADQVAEASTGGKKSEHYNQLFSCAACSCPLRAKVWYAGKIDLTDEELAEMPDVCWQKELYHIQRKG